MSMYQYAQLITNGHNLKSFPLHGRVESVKQLNNTTLIWVANVGGERKEWRAQITEQVPDHHISWRSEAGTLPVEWYRFRP